MSGRLGRVLNDTGNGSTKTTDCRACEREKSAYQSCIGLVLLSQRRNLVEKLLSRQVESLDTLLYSFT